ncbi:MAG: SGNH/GDSL hydrolase family protein [Clostridia bacterium]|nr:SGNH/GDSL hydrolase family protein [Clostridia bacterium]
MLTREEVEAITQGAEEVREENGAFHFYRFTREQTEKYRECSTLVPRTFATAGVKLVCRTDAAFLSLDYEMTLWASTNRRYAFFDIYANGKEIAHTGATEAEGAKGSLRIRLPEGEKKVELFMPWSASLTLSRVDFEKASFVTPVKPRCRMLIYGDSITQGYDAEHPSLSYASRVASALDAEAVNKAVGGERFIPGLLEVEEPFAADMALVAYGTNDWGAFSAEEEARRVRLFFERLTRMVPRVICVTPIWRADGEEERPLGMPLRAYADYIRPILAEFPTVRMVEGWDLVPHSPYLFRDFRLHPSDIGFAFYAENLLKAISE